MVGPGSVVEITRQVSAKLCGEYSRVYCRYLARHLHVQTHLPLFGTTSVVLFSRRYVVGLHCIPRLFFRLSSRVCVTIKRRSDHHVLCVSDCKSILAPYEMRRVMSALVTKFLCFLRLLRSWFGAASLSPS